MELNILFTDLGNKGNNYKMTITAGTNFNIPANPKKRQSKKNTTDHQNIANHNTRD